MLISPVNVSEGVRTEVVGQIADAAGRFCFVLDIHSDRDHNRSVVTLAGEADQLTEGILAAAQAALELIDLNRHSGVHPRFGAIDVVPFVADPRSFPLSATSPEAIATSIDCARLIWTRLHVPCFIYSGSPGENSVVLPTLRKEAFRTLQPDFGEHSPHPSAGAVAVGARPVLVAFNMNLDSADIGLAFRIAAHLRQQFEFVRALGLHLPSRGCVQVSCNLLRPTVITMRHVFQTGSEMAETAGVPILESEIAGLAPLESFGGLSPQALRFSIQPKVLEDCLQKIA